MGFAPSDAVQLTPAGPMLRHQYPDPSGIVVDVVGSFGKSIFRSFGTSPRPLRAAGAPAGTHPNDGPEGAGAAAGDARIPGGARTAAEDLAAAAAAAGGGRRSRSRPPLAAPGDGEDDRL